MKGVRPDLGVGRDLAPGDQVAREPQLVTALLERRARRIEDLFIGGPVGFREERSMEMSEISDASLRAAVVAFNDPSARERFLEFYAPEVVLHGYPRGIEGLEGARRFYSQLWSAFPDARIHLEETLAREDRLAARYTLSGVQAQDFYGAPVTGVPTNIDGIVWLRLRDGRAVEVWHASGTLDTLTRLYARAARAPTRHSASADAAELRWEETHPEP